jgi:hypothetical protein
MQWKNNLLVRARILTKTTLSYTFADEYLNINIRHMQSAFYMLILGYALAFVSFLIEIIWHRLI